MLVGVKNQHPKHNRACSEICTVFFLSCRTHLCAAAQARQKSPTTAALVEAVACIVHSCTTACRACMQICVVLWLMCHITQLNTTERSPLWQRELRLSILLKFSSFVTLLRWSQHPTYFWDFLFTSKSSQPPPAHEQALLANHTKEPHKSS